MEELFNEYKSVITILGIGVVLYVLMRFNVIWKNNKIAKEAGEADDENNPEKKFFLRRISDWWVPILFTVFYLVVNNLVILLPVSAEAISGLQGMLFRLLALSYALPVARYLILIFFPLMDNYSDEEKAIDFDNTSPNQRIWVYIVLVSLLVFLVAS